MLSEWTVDEYREYSIDYARRHPIRELGQIVGYAYPNGSICEEIPPENEEEDPWQLWKLTV